MFDHSEYLNKVNNTLADVDRANNEKVQRELAVKQAAIETAENTAEMRETLEEVVQNQNDYIRLLKQNNQVLADQLDMLKKIFVSGEDSVAVQKEIMRLISEREIDLKELIVDKGIDAALQLIFSLIPIALASLNRV